MPWSCFGKKDKKAGPATETYSPSPEQEPLVSQAPAPAPVQAAPAPSQTEAAPATPPTPVTPTSGDARLRPEDDPDKASRRRDVVASFYSDQCELIGFKATGSRPPSAVAGDNPAATSSPLSSPPSSSRACALSRADLALKRREFFKDLAVNDMSSSRYGASQPSWRMVDSGSLTTPRRSHQYEGGHHTLPLQARYGGLVLRPVGGSPSKATSGPDLHLTNGHSDTTDQHLTQDAKREEPLLPAAAPGPHESVTHHQEAGPEEVSLPRQHSEGDQFTRAAPSTPPATPATPPPTPPAQGEPPAQDQPLASETLIELAATHLEGGVQSSHLVVQQQQHYVQQVSVGSDDERLAEGSCILIEEAFPGEPRAPPDTSSRDEPDTTTASGSAPPSAPFEADREVSQHSSEQPTTPPPAETPGQRRPSLPQEKQDGEASSRHTDQAVLDTDQHFERPTSSPETSPPGSPQELRQPPAAESEAAAVAAVAPEQQAEPSQQQQQRQKEEEEGTEEARLSPTIVGCIPKGTPTQEEEPRPPSPPRTPAAPRPSSPPAREETRSPAPPAPPRADERAPPSSPTPPSLTEPRVTCSMDVSSSQLEDDGLGSDIDDALSSLECLSEEGNAVKRATAST